MWRRRCIFASSRYMYPSPLSRSASWASSPSSRAAPAALEGRRRTSSKCRAAQRRPRSGAHSHPMSSPTACPRAESWGHILQLSIFDLPRFEGWPMEEEDAVGPVGARLVHAVLGGGSKVLRAPVHAVGVAAVLLDEEVRCLSEERPGVDLLAIENGLGDGVARGGSLSGPGSSSSAPRAGLRTPPPAPRCRGADGP